MKSRERRTRPVVLCLALATVVCAMACVPKVYHLEYLSFEKVNGIHVESKELAKVQKQITSVRVPVRYRLVRDGYSVLIRIDSRSYFPIASFQLESVAGLRIVLQPEYGKQANRAGTCGSFDQVSEDGTGFEYSWVICDEKTAAPQEMTVAFDVIDAGGALVSEERIPFEIKSAGLYWAIDSV
jgi:hypothetical protein